ncbi:MAG: hypothetical protein ACK4N1_11415 [Pseudorhizobium sp.]
MKTIAMTMAFGLLAAPAFAQTSDSSSSDANDGETDQSSQAGSSSQMSAASQEKVREQLTQAGFQDVEILDASYLVRAQTEDGNTVLMVIDPPMAGMGGGSTSGSGSTDGSNGSNDDSSEED